MSYPDTNLRNDQRDYDYGGAPANAWGGLAFSWVNSVLRFLGDAYLTHQRVPYSTVVAVSQTSAVTGDVAVLATGQAGPNGTPYVGSFANSSTGRRFYGVFLEPVSASAPARIAVAGVLPQSITGITPSGSAADAGLDAATGRLRVATGGDIVVGIVDTNGNVILAPSAQAVP
jgi:hypothetical protein